MSNEKSNTPAKKLPPIKMRYVKRENVSVDDCIGMYSYLVCTIKIRRLKHLWQTCPRRRVCILLSE
jgi:hypothetical protein